MHRAAHHARNIEQIIHDMRQMSGLAIHDGQGLLSVGGGGFRLASDVQRIQNRCERAAQLMGQHRQELILATVGLAGRLFRFLGGGQVTNISREQRRLAENTDNGEFNRELLSIASQSRHLDAPPKDGAFTGRQVVR